VPDFCAGLRQLCRESGCDLAVVASELKISRSQLYAILNGEVKRPPDWAGLVGPLVAACTGGDARLVAEWRRRHAVLVGVWEELGRRDRQDRAGSPAAPRVPKVVCTLPAGTAAFTGRAEEIGQIMRAVPGRGGVVTIQAIGGMPGVGKTALAVHAGHLLAGRFPDRQLFADLHGHTPGQPPADPADVLAGLLAADGVDARYLPGDLEGRAALWRDRMAGKRVLLVLDNAAGSGQVSPLLPGTAGCLVLVTSRRFLGDLPGAVTQVPLDTLPPGDAAAMFASLMPSAAGDPAKVDELARLCGHLPLAISLLACLLARHRSWTMDDLIGQTRARLLTAAAENRTVAAAFELSYQYLDAERQRFFRLLGLHPGPGTDACAAAALAGLPVDEAAAHLDALHRDSLLAEPAPRRYQMHDLIRDYARGLAGADTAQDREQAVGRLLDYYQHAAQAADAYLARYTRTADATSSPPPAAATGLTGRDQAQAWMTAERANLLACIGYAAARGEHARVAGLTGALASHLFSDGPWSLAVTLHTAAVSAARHIGDRPGEASALSNLGDARRLTDDYRGAAAVFGQALGIYRDLSDKLGEANALRGLGDVRRLTGDYRGAAAVFGQALGIYRDLSDKLGEANALRGLGDVHRLTGDYRGAAQVLEQALGIYRDLSDKLGEASALSLLGDVRWLTGDYPGAAMVLEQALGIYRDLGNRLGEATARRGLGEVRRLTGDYRGGAEVLEQALDISRDLGDRLGEGSALSLLGDVRRLTGDYPAAATVLEQALDISRDLGNRLGEGNALSLLGDVRRLTGDYPAAAEVLEQALDIARDLGNQLTEATTLGFLGAVRRLTGDYPGAAKVLEQALDIYRDLGNRDGEAEALNLVGTMHLSHGHPGQARHFHQCALELARAIGSLLEEARALEGIGKCARATASAGDSAGTSVGALREALEIYRRIGAAEAERLAAELAAEQDLDPRSR
jgi:tetratricopeptide (TPR) repeat protein